MLEDFIRRATALSSLHHFTDAANIPSIRQHGLLSYAEAARRKVAISKPGGNDWSHEADARRGLDEYVHLSLTDNHPMLYHAQNDGRIVNAVYLRAMPEVLRAEGVLMTLDVSNKAGVPALPLLEAIPFVDQEILFTRMDWRIPEIGNRRRAAEKYEILIPKFIPPHQLAIPNGV